MAFFGGSNFICWASHKQKIVALSLREVEYTSTTTIACLRIWLMRLIGELIKEEAINSKWLTIDQLWGKLTVHRDLLRSVQIHSHLLNCPNPLPAGHIR